MSQLTAYLHPTCTTCEAARRWLVEHRVTFVEKDIRTSPPAAKELQAMMAAHGGERKKLLNTSGIDYRKQGLAAKLPGMADREALALLAGNGMLIKRPFLIGRDVALVGFNRDTWAEAIKTA